MVLPALVEFRWGGECMGNEPNDLSQVKGGGGGLGIRIYYRWSVANEGHDNILNQRAYNDPYSLVSGPAWKRKNQAAWWTNPFPPLLRALYAEPSSCSLLSFFFRLIFFLFCPSAPPTRRPEDLWHALASGTLPTGRLLLRLGFCDQVYSYY